MLRSPKQMLFRVETAHSKLHIIAPTQQECAETVSLWESPSVISPLIEGQDYYYRSPHYYQPDHTKLLTVSSSTLNGNWKAADIYLGAIKDRMQSANVIAQITQAELEQAQHRHANATLQLQQIREREYGQYVTIRDIWQKNCTPTKDGQMSS